MKVRLCVKLRTAGGVYMVQGSAYFETIFSAYPPSAFRWLQACLYAA